MKEKKLLTDISFYGEYPDFVQMAKNADGVILRAGQGGWIDPVFVENSVASKGLLPRGVYWFYDGRYKPSSQVDLLMEAMEWSDYDYELPIFGDFERNYQGSYESWKNFYDFMRILGERMPDAKLGIYTGYYYWKDNVVAHLNQEELEYYFGEYYLWEGNYNEWEDVKVPAPWIKEEEFLWQYTESGDGQLYGLDPYVKRAIDLNKFDGIWSEFCIGFDEIEEPPIEPPPAEDNEIYGKVDSSTGLYARTSPTTTEENKVGGIWQGSELKGTLVPEGDNIWFETKVYIAARHNGVDYMELENAPPEVPEEERTLLDPDHLVVPDSGSFMRIGHDFQSHYWNFEPRSSDKNLGFRKDRPSSPLPDTAKGKIDQFNPMSKEWQFFWRDLCRAYVPHLSESEFLEAMTSITADTRAMTDNKAAENGYTNWITGQNITGGIGKNMEIKELAFGGNLLKVLEDNGSEITAEAFDPSKSPPTVEDAMLNTPHLIMWANVSTCYRLENNRWDGRENAKPFPQLRDENGRKIGVPYPLMGRGGRMVFFKKSFTRKCLSLYPVGNGEAYSPHMYL